MIKKLYKQYKLYLVLLILILMAFLLWKLNGPSGNIGDFGLNLFTELIGIFITVALVEKIISKQKSKEMIPVKAAVYREIQVLMSRIIGFWAEVYDCSVPGDNPQNVRDLLNAECFQKMRINLNMDSNANVYPETTWWNWFESNGKEFQDRCNAILNRYFIYLEPNLYKELHYLLNDSFLFDSMRNTVISRRLNEREGIPKPKVLEYYLYMQESTYKTLLNIYNWCEETYRELTDLNYEVHKVQINYANKKLSVPKSMIDYNELMAQTSKFIKWQEDHKVIEEQ